MDSALPLSLALGPHCIGHTVTVAALDGKIVTGTLRAYGTAWVNLDDGSPSGHIVAVHEVLFVR